MFHQAYNLGSQNGKTGIEFLDNIEAISALIPYLVGAGIVFIEQTLMY